GDARKLCFERLPLREQVEPVFVELGVAVRLELAELLPVRVLVEHGEPRLRRAERQLVALPRDPCGEDPVFELVVFLGDLHRREAGLAGLAQPVQPLALVVVGRLVLTTPQEVELPAREEVLVAGHDRGLLGRFLLADAHGASFLRALVEVALESLLVLCRASNRRNAHVIDESTSPASRRTVDTSSTSVNGFSISASAPARSCSCNSYVPVSSAIRGAPSRPATSRARSRPSPSPRWTSTSRTATGSASRMLRAAARLPASSTRNPPSSRLRRQSMRIAGSSSTTSTVLPAGGGTEPASVAV